MRKFCILSRCQRSSFSVKCQFKPFDKIGAFRTLVKILEALVVETLVVEALVVEALVVEASCTVVV